MNMDIQVRQESNGTWTARVLSDIGGRGIHEGFVSAPAALRSIADRIVEQSLNPQRDAMQDSIARQIEGDYMPDEIPNH